MTEAAIALAALAVVVLGFIAWEYMRWARFVRAQDSEERAALVAAVREGQQTQGQLVRDILEGMGYAQGEEGPRPETFGEEDEIQLQRADLAQRVEAELELMAQKLAE